MGCHDVLVANYIFHFMFYLYRLSFSFKLFPFTHFLFLILFALTKIIIKTHINCVFLNSRINLFLSC